MALIELKSIDEKSYTVILTGVTTLISVLIALILVGGLSIAIPGSFTVVLYMVPTLIFGPMIASIFLCFTESYLYNILAQKMNPIKFDIDESGYINKISPKETALIVGGITLIMSLIIYFALSLILPLLLNSLVSIFMYSSQLVLAYLVYQYVAIFYNPIAIGIAIVITTILVIAFTFISAYLYNFLAGSDRGVTVNLSEEDKYTVLNSIDIKSFAIVFATVGLILNLITGVLLIILGGSILTILVGALISFFIYLIEALIIAVFYNFLAPKIGALKVELE